MTTVPAVKDLFDALETAEITYCHWKSNWALSRSLSGKEDIDLLVRRSEGDRFRHILDRLGYRPAIEAGVNPVPSVEHFYSMDHSTGRLIHVHAYYRVITGESLAKNYRLPLEDMLLGNTRLESGVVVPTKGAELVVFVIRMLLKHTQLAELALVLRDWDHVKDELEWLLTEQSHSEALDLVRVWIPQVGEAVFRSGVEELSDSGMLLRRILLGHRVRARLRGFARYGKARARISGFRKLLMMAFHRLTGSRKGLTPAGGGAVIAFVGSEATGKSTLLAETAAWLGGEYTVRRVHAGKPPSTLLTYLPNLFLPLLRSLIPGQRSTRLEAAREDGNVTNDSFDRFPVLYGIRAVMLAFDRRSLLRKAFARSANGAVVLCDRYPSSETGAPDSPQLGGPNARTLRGVRRVLSSMESSLYGDIPRPDLVIHLTAPLEVTLKRNALRNKTEPEEFVKLRHARSVDLIFADTEVHRIDTDRPMDETAREIRQIIWDAL